MSAFFIGQLLFFREQNQLIWPIEAFDLCKNRVGSTPSQTSQPPPAPNPSPLKISIIIPVINEAEQIKTSVEKAWNAGADEVLVVDGGSTDGTREGIDGVNCEFIESLPGRAVQMNKGAAAATGDILVFLHADNWLTPGCCEQLRTALAGSEGGFGGFRQQITNDQRIFRWIESGNGLRLKWQGLIYGDQAMFIERKLFDAVGGFPEMELMEDFEFSRMMCRHGKPLLLEGPTIVSARRWEKTGPIRQTVTNWVLSFSYRLGASPKWIASRYRRHDQN